MIGLLVLYGSVFIVSETEQAIVLRFGKLDRVVNPVGKQEPGLKFKRPFMFETVYTFDKRILDLNTEPTEVTASDQKRLIIDAFAKYQIRDPLLFFQSLKTEANARSRLDKILEASLRNVIGSIPLSVLLSEKRTEAMQLTQELLNSGSEGAPDKEIETKGARDYGLEVVDVRIMRVDLPKENSENIFRRMRTEREREAKEFRAEGQEEAQRITSKADKERTVILANARQEAEMARGDGDAQATRIFAEAYGRDEEFYRFYRTLQAYRETLGKNDTTMVLTPDSDFLYLLDDKNEYLKGNQ